MLTKHQLLLLLEKHKLGTCTEAEEAMLTQWFEQVPVIEELTFISAEEKERIKTEIKSAIDKRTLRKREGGITVAIGNFRAIGIAAAILLVCCSALFIYYRNTGDKLITVTVPRGVEKMPVMLPDSSEVWLASGGSISYPEKFAAGDRRVKLAGVAYFSVLRDKDAPFVVETRKSLSVKVLGTSFVVDVREETENIKISVITGRVQIDENEKKLDVIMPGESLFYSCQDKTFSKQKYHPEDMNRWENKRVIYLNAVSINELSVLLHTMYHVNLSFDHEQTSHYRFNMSFSKDLSIDEVLNILKTVSGLRFVRSGNEIKITP